MITLDLKGFITSVNHAAIHMLKYDADSMMGMRMSDFFEEDDLDQANAFFGTWLEALIMAGALEQIDACFVAKDGSRVPMQISRTSLFNDRDEVCGIKCIVRDMA